MRQLNKLVGCQPAQVPEELAAARSVSRLVHVDRQEQRVERLKAASSFKFSFLPMGTRKRTMSCSMAGVYWTWKNVWATILQPKTSLRSVKYSTHACVLTTLTRSSFPEAWRALMLITESFALWKTSGLLLTIAMLTSSAAGILSYIRAPMLGC